MDVLLIEDEPLVRQVEADALRGAGLVVVEAASAEEALAVVGGMVGSSPLVVVADLHLGSSMGGFAFGAEARRRWPEVGIVYATGYPGDLDGHLLGPRDHYVVKPFPPEALLHVVRRLMPPRVLGWTLH